MGFKETFSEETRIIIWHRDKKSCVICSGRHFLSIHHVVPNTKMNRRLYGNERVNSGINGTLVCQKCHDNHMFWDKQLKKNLISNWEEEIKRNENK